MKNYVVAIISFFENEIKQFKIEAESEYESVKKGIIEFTQEKYREEAIRYQGAYDYPKDLESLITLYRNSDMEISVIEI